MDFSKALETTAENSFHCKVFDSPSKLSESFINNEVSLVITNLFSYFQIRQSGVPYEVLVVPNQDPVLVGNSYKSAIFSKLHRDFRGLKRFQDEGGSITVYAVLKDSVSGGFLGINKLEQSNINPKKINIKYVGNHKDVVTKTKSDPKSIGIVSYSYISDTTSNILWVSDTIPFGPVICNPRLIDCSKIKTKIMENPEYFLKTLKIGWPEFNSSQKLDHNINDYHNDFYGHFLTFTKSDYSNER